MKPILVTGHPRSGTTWIGKMLSIPTEIGYIHEAYNILLKQNLPGSPDPFEFALTTEENKEQVKEEYQKIITYNSTFSEFFAQKKTFLNLINSIYQHFKFRRYRVQEKRPLIKDAYSIFASELLVDEFDAKPIILIRHPGPIFDSIKRLNWKIDFSKIYEHYKYSETSDPILDIIDESLVLDDGDLTSTERIGLLWTIVHQQIIQYQNQYSDWYFLRYEDIFTNLEHNFRKLYSYCDLKITDTILSMIYHYTAKGHFPSEHNPNDIEMPRHDLLNGWKNRITDNERDQLREITNNKIFENFYSLESWEVYGVY